MASPVILAATAKHTATLIFFHGLGDTGQGWAQAINAVRSPFVKVICPTANSIPVTLNAGFRMPSWFDLKTLDEFGPEDDEGIKSATNFVHSLINKEIQDGIPANRIVIGGFSQGGALALYSALTFSQKLAGAIGLSCWLPLRKSFPASKKCPDDVPIFQCHGNCDPVVPYRWGQMTASTLKTMLTNTEFRSYEGLMHTSNNEEMRDIKSFIDKVLVNEV